VDEKMAYWMSGFTGAAQPFCDEPLIAAHIFQHAGSVKAGIAGGLFGGLTRRGMEKDNARRAGGLPDAVLIALGPSKVYVFEYSPSGTQLPMKPPLIVWPRTGIRVTSAAKRVASKLTIEAPDGQTYELESASMTGRMGKMTLEMFRLLSEPHAH
jgi:hypothetical protein